MRDCIRLVALVLATAGCARAEAQSLRRLQSHSDAGALDARRDATTARRDGGPVLDVLPPPRDAGLDDVLGPRPMDGGGVDSAAPVTPMPVLPRDASALIDAGPDIEDTGAHDAARAPLRLPPTTGGGPRPPLLGGPDNEQSPPVSVDDAGAGPSR